MEFTKNFFSLNYGPLGVIDVLPVRRDKIVTGCQDPWGTRKWNSSRLGLLEVSSHQAFHFSSFNSCA